MSANGANKSGDSLSPRTLMIAAVASGVAAIVTSAFWKNGTFVTAALTPVIVALVKEGLQRPIESDLVRRPVQRMAATRTTQREPVYARTGAPPPLEEEPAELPRLGNDVAPPTGYGPVRTYGRPPRRRWHLKAAIVTGVLAFAIAAVVLTVPELVFGGSVAGKGRTTIFSHAKSHKSSSGSDEKKSSTDSTNTDTNEQTTPPAQQQNTDTTTTPDQTAPPAQEAPQQGGTPAPQQAPAPSAPPASSP